MQPYSYLSSGGRSFPAVLMAVAGACVWAGCAAELIVEPLPGPARQQTRAVAPGTSPMPPVTPVPAPIPVVSDAPDSPAWVAWQRMAEGWWAVLTGKPVDAEALHDAAVREMDAAASPRSVTTREVPVGSAVALPAGSESWAEVEARAAAALADLGEKPE